MNNEQEDDFENFTEEPTYKRRWWKMWWWLPDWNCYGFRWKWMRDFYDWMNKGL